MVDPVQSLWAVRAVDVAGAGVVVDVVRLVWPDDVVQFDVYVGVGDDRVCLTAESLDADPDDATLAGLVAAAG